MGNDTEMHAWSIEKVERNRFVFMIYLTEGKDRVNFQNLLEQAIFKNVLD